MKAEWITRQQYNDAWQKVNRITVFPPEYPLDIVVGFDEINRSSSLVPIYRMVRLCFRRDATNENWELVTPVQIVERWLAEEMQFQ